MTPVSARRRWWALFALFFGLLVVGLDVTILNVALPTLAVDLDASTADLQWIVDSFLVALAALLLPAGLLGDRLGRRKVLLAGLAIFAAACALASFADSVGMLIAARALMGVGAAVVMPVSMAVVPSMFSGAERTRAIAFLTAGMAIGLPLGPLLGGWLLEHYEWNSVFLINVPLLVLGFIAIAVLLPESTDRSAPRLQPLATLAAVLGLGAFVYGIIEAPVEGWTSAPTLVGGIGGLLLIAAFAVSQLRSGAPMVDLGLFRDRAFLWGSIVATAASMLMMGALFLVPQYLQIVEGHSAFGTGLRLLPMIGGLMVGGLASERVAERFGHRAAIVCGLGLTAAGCLIALLTDPGSSYGLAATWLAVLGAGFGMSLVPATDAVLAALPPERAAVGSALMQTMRQTGGAVGVAVLGSIASSVYRAELDLPPLPADAERAAEDSVAGAAAVAEALGAPGIAEAANGAFTDAMFAVFLVCAVLAGAVKVAAGLKFPKRVAPSADEGQSQHEPSRAA
ncbi:MFS transporter [Glycomyces harbinensis]|uniref:Drug resistance transporter, EmrB/QacA subfamily n=1 Tax=Glycomyces harbinensis TaxID=58114 RepID=A0A1G6Z4H3_9ACTN|nr:MFS transporter [Glycomyces harbinensis]SDD97550.1 drug resistance transporter, EmrB/QacA subfamily [Glycomyces harbinensis]